MIRLVFISTLAYNYFFPGKIKQAGGHTRIYNLSKAFARKKEYEVFCVTGDFGQEDIIEKNGVKLVKAPIDDPFAFYKVIRILRRINPDILVDFCASPRLFLYRLMKLLFGYKYVYLTCCDNDVNGDYKKVENPLFNLFYEKGLKKADRVISQVPTHQKLLRVNFGVESELILSPYLKIKENRTQKKEYALWVGRAAYYKRPNLFLELARKHPDYRFVMICNKSDYDKGFTNQIKNSQNIPENLDFHEYVPYPEMKSFYNKACMLVNTSDYEGFSNTFIEAAVCHTPIISLNSDPNNMLTANGAGFLCDGQFQQLSANCQILFQDAELRSEMGQNAFQYAFENHRIESAVDRFDAVFKSMY